MIWRTGLVALWMAGGGALFGGLYWSFLNTPESNAATLTASALALILMILVAAMAANGAVLVAADEPLASVVPRALRHLPAFLVIAVPIAVGVVLIQRADAWIATHSGEISAWFIARFGLADISPLFRAESWLSGWLRWIVLPVTGLSLLTGIIESGFRAVRQTGWLKRAWNWRTLIVSTAAFLLLVALPWRAAYWRPALPASWIEPVVAGLKLAAIAALMAIGSSIIVMMSVRKST